MSSTSPGLYGKVMCARCCVPSGSTYPSNFVSPRSTYLLLMSSFLPRARTGDVVEYTTPAWRMVETHRWPSASV